MEGKKTSTSNHFQPVGTNPDQSADPFGKEGVGVAAREVVTKTGSCRSPVNNEHCSRVSLSAINRISS